MAFIEREKGGGVLVAAPKMTGELQSRLAHFAKEFGELPNWNAKYQYLIELGNTLAPLSPEKRQDVYLVRGCVSKVWLVIEIRDATMWLAGDSEGMIPKGFLAFFTALFSGISIKEIQALAENPVEKFGLHKNLTPTRAASAQNLFKKIKQAAIEYKDIS